MYNQFFGNYLFSKGYVTKEQLIPALIRQDKEPVRVSTLALYSGFMSPSEIENITNLQLKNEKKFSELAMENGFLTQDQVLELLDIDYPNFLKLGQILIDEGVFSYEQFANILADYRSQNEFLELELNEDNKDEIQCLIENFSMLSNTFFSPFSKSYLELLYNNFIRFIGDDFTALPPVCCTEFPTECCVMQSINGNYKINTYLSMEESTALAFAERYTGEPYLEYNEYVNASIEDFINLHNGLFIVNASNDYSNELTIGVLESKSNALIHFEHDAYHFPIYYPFGIINFVIEIVEIVDPTIHK